MKKRLLPLLLSCVMLVSLLPVTAWAAETDVETFWAYEPNNASNQYEVIKEGSNNYTVNVPGTACMLSINAVGENTVVTSGTESGVQTLFLSIEAPCESISFSISETPNNANLQNYTVNFNWNVQSSTTPIPDTPAVGYTVSLTPETQSVAMGETAAVTLQVSHSDSTVTAYNAFHYEVSYDPNKLQFASVSNGADAADSNGTVTILGYGEDKPCGTGGVVVNFTAIGEGTSTVTLTAAKVDAAKYAAVQDAPEATIGQETANVNVSGYRVTLPDGFTGAGTVAGGEDYTFAAKDPYYDYEVTATMGDSEVPVIDNGGGKYTIENVSGNIIVSAAATPKKYSVTLEPANLTEVTFDGQATYTEDYTFTVNEQPLYTYGVSATVGGQAVTFHRVSNGTYTIDGHDIKGNIIITVNKTLSSNNATVSFEGTGFGDIDLAGSEVVIDGSTYHVKPGQDLAFTLNKDPNYSYTVMLNGSTLTAVDEAAGEYKIPAANLVASQMCTVTITKTLEPQTIEVTPFMRPTGDTVFCVAVTIYTPAEQRLMYQDQPMFLRSTEGNQSTYVYLLTASTEPTQDEIKDAVKLVNGAAETVGGKGGIHDVNNTGVVDVNDAQFVYNMYNDQSPFDPDYMNQFLRADITKDGAITVQDAAAVIDAILGK